MALRWRWPIRRQGDPDVSREAARSDGTPRDVPPEDHGQAAPVEIDPGFAGDFRGRAGDRDATPLLGPWGGLAETAQFAVAATHFQGTLVTQRFSDEVAAHGAEPGRSASDFISSLGSLGSYSDPAGTPGESGSPFADVLPVGRGDLFAPAPSAPVTPAYPSFSPAAAARAERPVARATVPVRAPATPAAPAASARRVEPPVAIQRSTDSSPAASRPRSTVTESQSPPVSSVTAVEATAPLPLDPASPSSPTAPEADLLPFAPPSPARDSAAAASTPGSVPAPLATPATSAPVVARLADPSAPEPRAAPEIAPPSADAAPPLPVEVLSESASGSLAGSAEFATVARLPVEPLPLADQSPSEPASTPSAAITPLPSDASPAGDRVPAAPPSSLPPAVAAPVLVQREPAPPLADADVPPQAPSAPAESPLTPRVRRFSIGEPLRADITPAAASGPGPSMPAPRESMPGLLQPAAPSGAPALPIARVTSVEPAQSVHEGPISDQPGSDVPPFAPARVTDSDLPLAGERGPETLSGASEPQLPFATAPSLNRGESSVRRVFDAATAPTGSAPVSALAPSAALLFRAPAAAPLRIEAAPAPTRVGRTTDTGTAASPPAEAAPAFAPGQLPLGPAGGRAEAASIAETGSPFPGQPSVQRVPAGFTAGTPAQRAPIVWRASDPGAVSMDAPPEASEAAATAGDAGPAEPQRSPEQDLDKLTEKVWQRLRRTLQLERERRRGLP